MGEWIHLDKVPKGRAKKLLQSIARRTEKVRPEHNYFLDLPASSPIDLDVPRLPFLLRNVRILDLDVSAEGVGPLARKMATLGLRAFTYCSEEGEVFAPRILRREGLWAECGWTRVRDTTVDFVGGGHADGSWSYDRAALVPCSTPKYVAHFGWTAGWDPTTVDPETSMGRHIASDENYGLGVAIRSRLFASSTVADRRLFRHVVFVAQPYQPPRTALKRLFERLRRLKYDTNSSTQSFALVLPTSSPIEQDVRRLPLLLLHKVRILDFDSGVHSGEDLHYTLFRLGMRPLTHQPAWTGAEYAPPILRRFGQPAGYAFSQVRDTTVDFVSPGQPTPDCANEHDYRRGVLLPVSTPKYIIHLHWPDGWSPGEVDLTTPSGQYSATSHLGLNIWAQSSCPDIQEATLVFSPHCAAPSRHTIDRIIIMTAGAMIKAIVLDSASFTVVGLERWLPDFEVDEFRDGLKDTAIASWLSRWDSDGTPLPQHPTVRKACDGIRFMTLEAWWDSLADMKEVVGVWPRHLRSGV
ncbi:uncharacterized protein LOC62_04G005273 [Vanrija pseudolonga]|uniref:Uncharacterized protein n=1 Tax=Vanrija pseudolonga TaxID=143232 RepID=A0AAF0Y9C0_9TREE|nr:hypothetical protein LOC62_04G005273 [Vanrija pseudolonga]